MFEVKYQRDAAAAANSDQWMWRKDCATCHDGFLVDTDTNMIVASDQGYSDCPEDMTLDRALSVFVDLLNAERAARQELQFRLDGLDK